MDTKKADTTRSGGGPKRIPRRINVLGRQGRKSPSVALLRKVQLPTGDWRLLSVAQKADGTYDFTRVVYLGQSLVAESGTYYIRFMEDGQKRRISVGESPREAQQALLTQRSVLELRAQGVEADDAPAVRRTAAPKGVTITELVRKWEAAPPLRLAKKSVVKYAEAYKSFEAWAKREGITHVSQVDGHVLTDYMGWMVRTRKLTTKTAVGKTIPVLTLLRRNGAVIKMERGDWPKLVEEQPEIYEVEDLQKLFSSLSEDLYTLYRTFLVTGFREQELANLAWDDFDASAGTLSVTRKIRFGFQPKNYMERTIPITPDLVLLLERRRKLAPAGTYLIFGTRKGRQGDGDAPDSKLLEKLKRAAWQAGLSCGRCESTYDGKPANCAERPICTKWGLHKFRHTCATMHARDGMDPKSLQKLLGHEDLNSTMRYIHALDAVRLAKRVNESSIAKISRALTG